VVEKESLRVEGRRRRRGRGRGFKSSH